MRERASGWEWLGKLLLALAVIFSVVVLVADVASAFLVIYKTSGVDISTFDTSSVRKQSGFASAE